MIRPAALTGWCGYLVSHPRRRITARGRELLYVRATTGHSQPSRMHPPASLGLETGVILASCLCRMTGDGCS